MQARTMAESKIARVQTLLDQAGQAHHHFEQFELGGEFDEDWPQWYAAYLLENGLGQLLARQPQAAELAASLSSITEEHQDAEEQRWSAFVAPRLLQEFGESP